MSRAFIDIPSYFDPKEKLEAFLKDMEKFDQSSPDVQQAIALVQSYLKDREGSGLQ
jgi:hypothetical protein